MARIDDAIDGLSARELEDLRAKIDRRLQACIIDGTDGAIAVRATAKVRGSAVAFSLLLCPACIERHRLPEGRAE